jgi:hypothetical protein
MMVFLDVLKRYPDHMFAYACIMSCSRKIGMKLAFENPEWSEYIDHFLEQWA